MTTTIAPDLHSLGFDAPSWEALVMTASAYATGCPGRSPSTHPTGANHIRCVDDASGARLFLATTGAGTVGESTTTFTGLRSAPGSQSYTAEIIRVTDEIAHIDLYKDDVMITRILADTDDRWTVPRAHRDQGMLNLAGAVPLDGVSVTAISMETNVFPDSETAHAAATEAGQVPIGMVCPSLFTLYSTGDPSIVDPYAMVSGEVLQSDRMTNSVTGVDWYRIILDSAFPLTMALPANLATVPDKGTYIAGYVKLCVNTGVWGPGR